MLGEETRVLRHAIHVRRLSMWVYRSKSLPRRRNKDKEKRGIAAVRRGEESERKGHVTHLSAKSN